MVETSIGRHFGTAERTFFRLACESYPPPPYSRRIFIELHTSVLKPKFYQKVLADFGLQNWYPQNFALDPWRHLLRYEPGLWRRGRPARDLRERKVWKKNLTARGPKTGLKFFVWRHFRRKQYFGFHLQDFRSRRGSPLGKRGSAVPQNCARNRRSNEPVRRPPVLEQYVRVLNGSARKY